MRKNKMKKRSASVLALSLVITLLMSACGTADNSPSSASSLPKESEAKEDASSAAASSGEVNREPIVLKVLASDKYDMDKNLMTKRIEELFNVDLQFEIYSDAEGIATRLNLLLASEEIPDIVVGGGIAPEQIVVASEQQAFLPLNDYIVEGTNYKLALDENPKWRDYVTSPDGNIYTFFETDIGQHMIAKSKMFYRADWLEKLGWSNPPATTEEFKEYLIDIRDNDVNGNGDPNDEIPLAGYSPDWRANPLYFLMAPYGLAVNGFVHITDDGEPVFEPAADYWRKGLAYIADLYEEGLLAEETFIWDQATMKGLTNKVGEEAVIGVYPHFWRGPVLDNKPEAGTASWDDYLPLAPLKGDYQQAAACGGVFRRIGAISADCEYPDVAFAILDWMLTEEAAFYMLFGEEGINWEWTDGESLLGTTPSIRVFKEGEYEGEYVDWDKFWGAGRAPWRDVKELRYGVYNNPEDKTSNTRYLLEDSSVYEPYYVQDNLPLQIWPDEEIIVEYAEYKTLLNEYANTASVEFILGIRDINDDKQWESYLDELNAMGLDEYVEILYEYYGLK